MDNFFIDKKMIKQKNREATIKHYILGCILECTVNEDVNVVFNIRKLLVYDLKIITEETFICCLHKLKMNRMLMVCNNRRSYRLLKENMEIISHDKKEQVEIMRKLYDFASSYENGIYINSKINETNFLDK